MALDDNASTEPRRQSARKPLIMAAGVVVLALLIGGAFVLFGGDDESTLTVGQNYSGPNTDLMFLNSFSADGNVDEVTFAEYGSDEQPMDLVDGFFQPARLAGPDGPSLAAVGGPLVGLVYRDGEPAVIRVDRSTGDETELLDGGDDYDVRFDPRTSSLMVVEVREASDNRCYLGELMGELRRVGRGDRCSFSASGSYIVIENFDEETVTYEISDRDGTVLASGESVASVEFMPNERFLISFDGGAEKRSAVITDLETGEIVVESSRGEEVAVLDTNLGGFALVASHDGEGEALVEVLSTSGEVREIVSNAGPVSAGFLTTNTDEAVVSLTTVDRSAVSIASRPDDGAEAALDEVVDGTNVQTLVLQSSGADRIFVVASRDGDDGVLNVSTRAGVVEVDVNDLEYIQAALLTNNNNQLLLEVLSSPADDGSGVRSSLLAVNLADGTHSWVIEDWESFRIRDVSADAASVLIVGREDTGDGEVAVVHLSLDGTLELVDEAEQINGALYTRDGAGILFTAFDGGDHEVLEYRIGERTRPTLLHGDVELSYAGWQGLDAPRRLQGLGYFEPPLPGGLCSTEFPSLSSFSVGSSLDGFVPEFGSLEACLQIDDGSVVIVAVSSGFDPIMEISGPYGSPDSTFEQFFADDSNGSNPLINEYFEPGAYFVVITGYNASSGSLTVQAS